jgi:2-polyprenyl-6-methoxyphenol hydroxylase-like FAD-dependent oxidoreductase
VRKYIDPGSMSFVFGGNGFFGYFYSNSDPSSPHRDPAFHVSEPGELVAWWSTYALDECPEDPQAIDREDVARQLRERHSSWQDPVIQTIIHSGVQIDSVYPTWTSPELPTWERDGVILVGDAAHALPPTSGQGSSQALEDVEALALFLSHYLRESYQGETHMEKQAINRAAKQYVALRQPHVKKIRDRARQMQDKKRTMSVVEEWVMYAVMWVMGEYIYT